MAPLELRLPRAMSRELQARAAQAGMTVEAYLRDLIIKLLTKR